MRDFSQEMAKINNELAKAYGGGRAMAKAIAAPAASKEDGGSPGETGSMIGGEEFLEKALQAVGRKHISTTQLIEAEGHIRAGKRPPAAVVRAVMTGTPYWPF
jgi:hypothetical protein